MASTQPHWLMGLHVYMPHMAITPKLQIPLLTTVPFSLVVCLYAYRGICWPFSYHNLISGLPIYVLLFWKQCVETKTNWQLLRSEFFSYPRALFMALSEFRLGLLSDTMAPLRGTPLDTLCAHLQQNMQYREGERDAVFLRETFTIEWPNRTKVRGFLHSIQPYLLLLGQYNVSMWICGTVQCTFSLRLCNYRVRHLLRAFLHRL